MITIPIYIDEKDVRELDRLIRVRYRMTGDIPVEELISYRSDAIGEAIRNYIRLQRQIEQVFVKQDAKRLQVISGERK